MLSSLLAQTMNLFSQLDDIRIPGLFGIEVVVILKLGVAFHQQTVLRFPEGMLANSPSQFYPTGNDVSRMIRRVLIAVVLSPITS